MLSRKTLLSRRIAITSLLVGVVFALLAGGTQFYVSYHKRTEQFDNTITELKTYLNSYFGEVLSTIDTLQPLTMSLCEDVSS